MFNFRAMFGRSERQIVDPYALIESLNGISRISYADIAEKVQELCESVLLAEQKTLSLFEMRSLSFGIPIMMELQVVHLYGMTLREGELSVMAETLQRQKDYQMLC